MFLCDFHREQAWERWTAKAANGVSPIKDEVLAKFRLIANSETENIYQERVCSLKESNFWKENQNLQVWFENHWLKEHKVSASYTCAKKLATVIIEGFGGKRAVGFLLKIELCRKRSKFRMQFCLGALNNVLYVFLLKFSSFTRYYVCKKACICGLIST